MLLLLNYHKLESRLFMVKRNRSLKKYQILKAQDIKPSNIFIYLVSNIVKDVYAHQ